MRTILNLFAGLGAGLLLLVLLSCSKTPESTELPAQGDDPRQEQTKEEGNTGEPENGESQKAEETMPDQIILTVSGKTMPVTLADNAATKALVAALREAPITYTASDYGGFEKVGALGRTLPASDSQMTTEPGDVILYSGNQVVLFYGSNSWRYTRLGKMQYTSLDALKSFLNAGGGDIQVTLSLPGGTASQQGTSESQDPSTKLAPTVVMNNGILLPGAGIGTYSLHGATCVNSVYSALKSGVRLIDTAYMYGNEEEVGQAVRQAVAEGICKREDITVITKIYPGSQYRNPEAAIEQALAKLDIGYIDIMLLHHPGENDVKAYKAMEKYQAAGKIKSLGISCFYVKELSEFLPQVRVKPVLVQNEIHPYYQDTAVVDYIHKQGIVVQAWYPLGGRGHQGELLKDPVLADIAKAHGKSIVQVILRWHWQRNVVAIPGSSNPAHIAENHDILDFKLSDGEMARIAALDRHEKHDWY